MNDAKWIRGDEPVLWPEAMAGLFLCVFLILSIWYAVAMVKICWKLVHQSRRDDQDVASIAGYFLLSVYAAFYMLRRLI